MYLNWTSLTSKKYKIGLIFCLLDRIWKICSDQEDRDREVTKLRSILAQNQYPEHVIEREIEKFVTKRNAPPNTQPRDQPPDKQPSAHQQPDGQAPAQPDPPKRYIVLPYVSYKAEDFAKRLKTHVNKHFPLVDFSGSDGCDASYIGKTSRILCHGTPERCEFGLSTARNRESRS